jgi:hypothetical protein
MGVFHQWWLCNSGGCSGVVCSKSGADLHQFSITRVRGRLQGGQMAITNTVREGGNTTKDVRGDRGGPKMYIVVQRYLGPAKMVQSGPKICEVI